MHYLKTKSAIFGLLLTFSPLSAYAQTVSDMWTGFMNRQDLFHPHPNHCNSSTEAFVSMTPNGDGFCIEKTERTAAAWEEARNDCADDYKRLPEPAEFKYACTRAGSLGLSNMTGGWEWMSNFPSQTFQSSSTFGMTVAMGGYTNCNSGAFGDTMTWTSSSSGSLAYRCVR